MLNCSDVFSYETVEFGDVVLTKCESDEEQLSDGKEMYKDRADFVEMSEAKSVEGTISAVCDGENVDFAVETLFVLCGDVWYLVDLSIDVVE